MGLPTTVFIVANAKRQIHVGYSKDLEVTLSFIADGTYDPSLAKKGIDKLVFIEEHNTIREALARVAEIEALSPAEKRRLVSERNPGWKALAADGRFAQGGIPGQREQVSREEFCPLLEG